MVLSLANIREMATPPPEALGLQPQLFALPNSAPSAPPGPAGPLDSPNGPIDVNMEGPTDLEGPPIDPVLLEQANAMATLHRSAEAAHRDLLQYFDPLVTTLKLRNEARLALKRFLQVQWPAYRIPCYILNGFRLTRASKSP